MSRPHTAAVLCLAFSLAATPVPANGEENRSSRFRYSPAETRGQSAEQLYDRIVAFARRECRKIGSPAINNPKAERCERELVESLVRTIAAPELAAYAGQATVIAAAR